MLADQNHQISGTHTVERVIRFLRPAFLLESPEDFRSVVKGACGFSGGIFCHLIPVRNGQLAEEWASYIQRLQPDALYVPNSLVDLKSQMQNLMTGHIRDVNYANPVSWVGSPALHSILARRNPDGSSKTCGPSYLIDAERVAESPPVSELQRIARFGIVPVVPIGDPLFRGVQQQLWDLVHTVPPSPTQGPVDWLLNIPAPDRRAQSPPYLAEGGNIHSVVTLNCTGMPPGRQSFPTHHRDAPQSLANKLVVVGDGRSLEDACVFWNLRANRSPSTFPAWITPEQAEDSDVARALVDAAKRTQWSVAALADGVDDLHFLSATMDTRDLARNFSSEVKVHGWGPTDWIRFTDRRHRRYYGLSKEAMAFSKGHSSFVLDEDALPCPSPTQVTVAIEIEAFRPPPTNVRLAGTSGPHNGRFGEAVIPMMYWPTEGSVVEVSLGYPCTFDIVKKACEEAGFRPSFDRKAALAYGINRILANDYDSHIILRNHGVLDLIRITMESEKPSSDPGRYFTPKGISFGEFHKELGNHELARALISWLLRKSLIFRGLELECEQCGTNAWYSLNDVGNQFQCVGCQSHDPFDVMPDQGPWRYRINHLLGSALDQGVLQQAFAAYDMDLRVPHASRNYLFPNVILADNRTGGHVAEIDLLGFEDGEWIVAECKGLGDPTRPELEQLRCILSRLGGGRLELVRASTASEEFDQLVDRVVIWDYEPIREQVVSRDQLSKSLGLD